MNSNTLLTKATKLMLVLSNHPLTLLPLLREHHPEAHGPGICVEDEGQLEVSERQHRSFCQRSLELVTCSTAVLSPRSLELVACSTAALSPLEQLLFLGQSMQQAGYHGEILDETSAIRGQPQEAP